MEVDNFTVCCLEIAFIISTERSQCDGIIWHCCYLKNRLLKCWNELISENIFFKSDEKEQTNKTKKTKSACSCLIWSTSMLLLVCGWTRVVAGRKCILLPFTVTTSRSNFFAFLQKCHGNRIFNFNWRNQ